MPQSLAISRLLGPWSKDRLLPLVSSSHSEYLSKMAPKRKAPASGGRASKRVASGTNTPVSMGSSNDEYSDSGDDYDDTVPEAQDLDSQWPLPVRSPLTCEVLTKGRI